MAKKEFTYKGKKLEELKKMSLEEFAEVLPSRQRRKLKRGLKENEKKLIKEAQSYDGKKPIRTHLRDMIIVPQFLGKKFAIYNGKDWNIIEVVPEMLGHVMGEFSLTRKKVNHSGPGIGATRGTKFTSVK
jgi:small subunit ribosomal protein S19